MIRFLEGQVAVVTGASRGLGASTARLLASAGATTVLVARSELQVQSVAADLAQAGHTVFPIATDIANPAEVDTVFRTCQERFGRVDLVVNIAGTIDGIGKQSWLLEAQEWQALAGTNIAGPFLLCHNAVPMMLRAGGGRILMLTSSSAERPTPMAGPYGATKAAVNQLVRAMAEELTDTGVTINGPGPTKSRGRAVATLLVGRHTFARGCGAADSVAM